MKKRILSVFLALSMTACAFSGCSDPDYSPLDKNGKLRKALSYEKVSSEYRGVEYSYKVRSDFTSMCGLDELLDIMYVYDEDVFFCFFLFSQDRFEKMSSEAIIEFYDHSFNNNEQENYSSQIISFEEYDLIKVTYVSEETRVISYTISDDDFPLRGYNIVIEFPVGKDENLIEQLAFEWFDNLECNGELETDIVTSCDNDYFSLDIPSDLNDYFEFQYTKLGNTPHAKVTYQRMNTFAERASSFDVEAITDSEYTSAEDYLKDKCAEFTDNSDDTDSITHRKVLQDVQKTKIAGYDGYYAVYSKEIPKYRYNFEITEYAFEKNGIVYNINIALFVSENMEQMKAEFEKLIDSIIIK